MITKIIFQTHEYKYEDLPDHYKKVSMSWKNVNPGWEYVYHDKDQRSEYVLSHSEELHNLYKKVIKPHQADIWRYLIVRDLGGVYADMDSFCIVPMDYILDGLPDHIDLVSTATEKNTNHTNNANFAAIKNSKILGECIENILLANSKNNDLPDQEIIHLCFSDAVMNTPEIVSQTMRASHGATYKENFDENIRVIDYYGQEMTYKEFLLNQNMI
jgi:mannosyltransferase OCH1-like enzyme